MAVQRRLGRLGTMTIGSVYGKVAKTDDVDHKGDLPYITHLPQDYCPNIFASNQQLDAAVKADGGNIPFDPNKCDGGTENTKPLDVLQVNLPLMLDNGVLSIVIDTNSPLTVSEGKLTLDVNKLMSAGFLKGQITTDADGNIIFSQDNVAIGLTKD